MLLRYRRYRVFIAFAVIALFAFYSLHRSDSWEGSTIMHSGTDIEKPHPASDDKAPVFDIPDPDYPPEPLQHPPSVPGSKRPTQDAPAHMGDEDEDEDEDEEAAAEDDYEKELKDDKSKSKPKSKSKSKSSSSKSSSKSKPKTKPAHIDVPTFEHGIKESAGGTGRQENNNAYGKEKVYWEKPDEHFPVSKTIKLPTGTPKPQPRIQYKFSRKESASEKKERQHKLMVIKEAFTHAWNGYKEHALMHDELKPLSGASDDPFCGWSATLVDSLDTLWIMGMKEEFENATKLVEDIDFTTTFRDDIPVFETTIRYMGGLLAAYDVSGQKYEILLEKAKELGEILIGCFDTPNRMPVTYYHWKPELTAQPSRAGSNVVLAELGSMTMEFTRLAQITGEDKYYDAIARVTNALQEWQMDTRVPGIWPTTLDASGCVKPDMQRAHSSANAPSWLKMDQDEEKAKKRGTSSEKPLDPDPNCIPTGLGSSSIYNEEVFTIGGLADSTYEYLPKQHLLLGGVISQYKDLYGAAADAIIDNLLYRPMLPDNDRHILMTGRMNVPGYRPDMDPNDIYRDGYLDPEGAHLTCFAGAMFGLGAKIFERDGEMELASRLTDFCVWAYNSTTSGIMPESFRTLPCQDSDDCEWDQAFYYKSLDPNRESRAETYKHQLANYKKKVEEFRAEQAKKKEDEGTGADEDEEDDSSSSPKLRKRQLKLSNGKTIKSGFEDDEDDEEIEDDETLEVPEKGIYHPKKPLTHKEFVETRIEEERIPVGMVTLDERKYILRPEAIESVFYMYRMTGEEYWRESGWNMFTSIIAKTRTEFAHSAIDDVTKEVPAMTDKMESFWLGETLKYFYLLFADEDLLNLDDWVLNTEAHPFLRPDAAVEHV